MGLEVGRVPLITLTVANGSTAAVSAAISSVLGARTFLRGLTKQIKVTVNNNTGNATATFAIVDAAGATLYSVAALAENATHVLLVERVITEKDLVQITPSGDPGTSTMICTIQIDGVFNHN